MEDQHKSVMAVSFMFLVFFVLIVNYAIQQKNEEKTESEKLDELKVSVVQMEEQITSIGIESSRNINLLNEKTDMMQKTLETKQTETVVIQAPVYQPTANCLVSETEENNFELQCKSLI